MQPPVFEKSVNTPTPAAKMVEKRLFTKTAKRVYQIGSHSVTVLVEFPAYPQTCYSATAEDPQTGGAFNSTFSYRHNQADAIAECLGLWEENVKPFIR